jgi:hypothetical protein
LEPVKKRRFRQRNCRRAFPIVVDQMPMCKPREFPTFQLLPPPARETFWAAQAVRPNDAAGLFRQRRARRNRRFDLSWRAFAAIRRRRAPHLFSRLSAGMTQMGWSKFARIAQD